MRKRRILVFSISVLLFLTSCSNERSELIEKACEKIDFAWDVYSIAFQADLDERKLNNYVYQRNEISEVAELYIPEASGYLKEAGLIFRNLSAEDSGFAEYSELAFKASALDALAWADPSNFGDSISKLFYFCGAN
jgi:hypothetical protein